MILFFGHLLIIAICLILKIFEMKSGMIGIFFVVLSSIVVLLHVAKINSLDKWTKLVIMVGFAIRVILVMVDVFVARLPDAASDDDAFYAASLEIFDSDYSKFSQNIYGGVFSKILSITYFFIGSSRLSAQYLNVLFFAISIAIFAKAMCNFGISKHFSKIGILLLCLMPNTILVNSILRRESIIELCVCGSIFFLSKWHKKRDVVDVLYVVLLLAIASLFHTVFIIAVPLFVIYFALYDKNKNAVSFSINKVSKMILLLTCTLFLGVCFLSMWSNKFSSVSDMDSVYTATNRARGGSVYLENYKVNSIGELVLFTPLKLIYFLFSPMPWKFRSAMDVFSFVFDSMVYLVLIIKIIKNPKRSMTRLLLYVFMVLATVFALGTFNSGTAIRHRFSLLPYLLAGYAISETYNTKKTNEKMETIKGNNK